MSRWKPANDQWWASNRELRQTLAVGEDEYEREYREFLSKRPECSSACIFESSYFLLNLDRLGLAYKSTPNFSSIFPSGHDRTIRHPTQENSFSASEDERKSLARQVYTDIDAENQTRLIKLLPGAFEERIVCELITHRFTDVARKYEALSYTWGKPLFTAAIKCNGLDFHVTQNLSNALRFMRHRDAARWLWIDAISINQHDSDEKSRHIQNMYQIYSKAQNTLMWLGLANEKDHILLDQIRVVSEANDMQLAGWHRRTCAKVILQVQDSLQRFLGRPWFKRSWVRQEVAASRNCVILCSDICTNFRVFERGVRRLLDVNVILARDLASIRLETDRQAVYFTRLLQQREDLNTVYERALAKASRLAYPDRYVPAYIAREWFRLVVQGFVFRATDTRDKIYSMGWALEGPIPKGQAGDPSHGSKTRSEFQANYTIPTSIVFQNFIKAIINRGRTLEPLSLFRTPYRVDPSNMLPAWAFDMKKAVGGRTPSGSPGDVGLAEKQELSSDFVPLRLHGAVLGCVSKELPFEGSLLDLANVRIDDIRELGIFSVDGTSASTTEKIKGNGQPWECLCASFGYSFLEVEVTKHAQTHLGLDATTVVVCASDAAKNGALIVCAYGGYHPYVLNHNPSFQMENGEEVQVFAGPAILWTELDATRAFECDDQSLTDRTARAIGWRRWRPDPSMMNDRRLGGERDFRLI